MFFNVGEDRDRSRTSFNLRRRPKMRRESPKKKKEAPKGLSMDAIRDALQVIRSVDTSVDPGQQLLKLLTMQKLASQMPDRYQAKYAFLDDSKVLAEYKDRLGDIKVIEKEGKYLDLSFKDTDVQSRLNLLMPKRPELKYIQTMLVAPLFFSRANDLENVLIIGHGAGTIPKYYTDFYRSQNKVIVDLRPILFDISQEHFLYRPDNNTVLIPSEASVFLSNARASKNLYDIINIDIFIEGPADCQMEHYFWDNVASILSDDGVSVTNVWKGHAYSDKYDKIVKHHDSVFNTIFEVVNSDTSQVALFGSQVPFEMLNHSNIGIKAAEISGLTAVDFNTHLKNIRRIK